MTAGNLAEPTLESVETLLRAELAQSDIVLSTAAPVLRHLLANEGDGLLSDEVVARTRGLLADLAGQLLDALAEEMSVTGPVSFMAEHRDAVVKALAAEPALLAHLHALAIEGGLALRIEERTGIDPVLCPLLRELVGSRDDTVAGIAMAVLAAQARFVLHHRGMMLPLSELPSDLFRRALDALQRQAAAGGDAAAAAAQNLGKRFDERRSRLGLIAQLLERIGGPAPALDVAHAGVAVFATALAQASGQERELCLLSLAGGRAAHLALQMRAAGLAQSELENQLLNLDAEAPLPRGFEALSQDRASRLLHGSQSGE